MQPDKLTEAVSRLNEAEYQLGHLIPKLQTDRSVQELLREIQTEVRRGRMRIEEFKEGGNGAAEDRS